MSLFAIVVDSEFEIVAARKAGRALAKEIGFDRVNQARITSAISELAQNIYLYAGKGEIAVGLIHKSNKRNSIKGIKVIAKDKGPGIDDIVQALGDGYTTSERLGAGLPGVKRLMDEFFIESELGKGTKITAIKWLRKRRKFISENRKY